MYKLSDDTINTIVQKYKEGMSVYDICNNYNVSNTTVYKYLKQTDSINHGFDYRYITDIEKENIKQNYINGKSSVEIGKMYNCGHKPILRILRDMGIKPNQKRFARKYKLNETYFDNIDTPNKAYIMGLLHSDGSNNISKSTVSISLQEEDRDILERVRLEIGSEKPLEYLDYSNKHDFGYLYKNQYRLNIFSKHICEMLNDKGIVPDKSLKIGFPNWIDEKLLSHYTRGVFDGDGSLCQSYRNENNKPIIVTITATEDYCKDLQKYCQNILSINPGIYDASCHNGITKVFTISGRNVCKIFLDWLYKDADLFLQRKYDRFCNYYNINNSLLD
jgi:intein-encoded DNA endonuclease-like protein